jgi:hypothetical protein
VPDVFAGNAMPDPSEKPELGDDSDTHVETAFAQGAGSSADTDGTHHDGAAPGEGEGTGIGESGG